MRKLLLLSVLFVAATLLACDEDPMAPPTTGSISLKFVRSDEANSQLALQQVASAEAASDTATSAMASPESLDSRRGSAPRLTAYTGSRFETVENSTTQTDASDSPTMAPAASTAIDAATIRVIGPTPSTHTNQAPGSELTINNLTPGSYRVVFEGIVGGEVEYFGQTTVEVNAGPATRATMAYASFRPVIQAIASPSTNMAFSFSWNTVPGAENYYVELDDDPGFGSPASATVDATATFATVPDIGTWYVRASAVNQWVTRGRAGDAVSVDIVTDIDPSGADFGSAYPLGFGSAAGVVTYSQLNVVPAIDEDWYSVEACLGDRLIAEVFAERLDPPSDLDAYVELFDPSNNSVEAQDNTVGTDSRIDRVLSSGGFYYIKVASAGGNSTGNYELKIEVVQGAANDGSSCSILPGATNSWTGGDTTDPTDWSAPGNWFTGEVPTPTDAVSIPAGAAPILTQDVTIAGLAIEPGGHVETNGWNLTVTGDLAAGNSITGTGTVILTGPDVSMSGGVPNLLVTGDVSLAGRAFAIGNVEVQGALRLNGYQMAVDGMFSTINGSGVLEMATDADTLAVSGLATFAGGPTTDMLTAGRLILAGGIRAQAVAATFAPSGTHRVVMAGIADRTITDVVGVSFFNELDLQTTGIVSIAGTLGQTLISGQLISPASITPIVTGGNLLAYGVAVQNMVLNNATLLISNGVISALDGVIFRNFPAGTQQLIINRPGGSHTFNNLQFSQDNGAADAYIEARDAVTDDNDTLKVTLAGASPIDGSPGETFVYYGALVNWVVAQAGPPSQVSFTVQPGDVTAGGTIAPIVQVAVQDAFTNTVDTSTALVTIAINDNPNNATLAGTTTVAAVNGVASFGDLAITSAAPGYTLIATSPTLNPEVSSPFTVMAAAAFGIELASGDGQTAAPGATLPDPIAVRAFDMYGNGVAGVDVTWLVTQGDGSVTSSVTTTDATGIATNDFTLGTLGANMVDASTGLSGSPVTFNATAAAVVEWASATSGNWSEGTNWIGGAPPTVSETAVISIEGSYTVTIDADISVGGISLGGGATGPQVEATGRTIVASGTVRVGENSSLSLTTSTLSALEVINVASITLDGSTINGAIDNRAELIARNSTTIYSISESRPGSALRIAGSGADVTLSNGFDNYGTIYFVSAEAGGYPSLYVENSDLYNHSGGKIVFAGLGGGYLEMVGYELFNDDSLIVQSAETVTLAGSVQNDGVMYAGTAELDIDGDLYNSGIISIGPGQTFGSYGDGNVFENAVTGDIRMEMDATLDLSISSFTSAVGFTVDSSLSIWIDGTGLTGSSATIAGTLIVLPGGTFEVLNTAVAIDSLDNSGDLTLDGVQWVGRVHNRGWFGTASGSNSITGSFTSASAGTLEVAESNTELTINGDVTNDGSIEIASVISAAGTAPTLSVSGGVLVNSPSGMFTVSGQAGGLLNADFDNHGTIEVVGPAWLNTSGTAINNTGAIDLTGGSMGTSANVTLANSGTITIGSGLTFGMYGGGNLINTGTIGGFGTIDLTDASFTSSGNINPGGSPGALSIIGDVTLAGGAINLELDGLTAGTEYDVLNVTSNVDLGGELALHPSITPTVADTFQIMTFGSRTGMFSSISGQDIGGGLALSPRYGDTDIKLVVTTGPDSVVVGPTSATLISAGATQQFGATAFSGDQPLVGVAYTWSSLNTNVATIDADGLVTAVASGQTTIVATSDGVNGYALVTVAIPGATQVNLWTEVPSGLTSDIRGIWGTSASDVYAVSTTTDIIRYDGANWNSFATGLGTGHEEIWGTSSTDIFALGPNGGIRHYNGTDWQSTTAPTSSNNLMGIWGTSPVDVMAVGWDGVIVHFDGNSWESMPSSTTEILFDVWGASSTDYIAVGNTGTILRYDGTSWASMTSNTTEALTAVWGTAANDVFAVSASGSVFHYDGSTWASFSPDPGTSANLRAVWGSSASDLYVLGHETVARIVLHFDGSSWTTDSVGTLNFFDVWGTDAGDVWASAVDGAIYRGVRGATVSTAADTDMLNAIGDTLLITAEAWEAGGSPITGVLFEWSSDNAAVATVDQRGVVTAESEGVANIWATATGGARAVRPITVQQQVSSVTVSPAGASITGGTQAFTVTALDINGNPISSPSVTWTVLNTRVASIDGAGTATAVESGQTVIEANVGGVSSYAVLTVAIPGASPVTAWGTATDPSTADQLLGAWGTASDNVFMGGDGGTIIRYDGSNWSLMTTPNLTQIQDFWGVSSSDLWAVGGGAFHFDGTEWTNETWPGGSAFGVWGSSPDDIWAVGANGLIVHYDGNSWASQSSPTTEYLYDIWGLASDDIYAVGNAGTILHFDGTSWNAVTSNTAGILIGVWGTATDDVYFVGGDGVMHWDGSTSIYQMSTPTSANLTAIWGTSSSDIYAVGLGAGVALHYDGSAWNEMTMPATASNPRAIWGTPDGDLHVPIILAGGGTHIRGVRGATVVITAPSSNLVGAGAQVQLTAEAQDGAAAAIPGVVFTWSSSDSSVAIPSATGLVTAVDQGSADISASVLGGASSSTPITVQIPAAVVVSPAGGAARSGNTVAFTADLYDEANAIINNHGYSTTWAAENANIATVGSSTGIATGSVTGQTAISATMNGIVGYGLFTVSVPNTTPVNVWTEVYDAPGQIWRLISTGDGDEVYATTTAPNNVLRYDGSNWVPVSVPSTGSFYGGWAGAPDDVFLTGEAGEILHYDGTSWESQSAPNTSNPYWSAWGSAPNDIWAVSEVGMPIIHYDGTSWTNVTNPAPSFLWDVWGSDSANVFAVGGSGGLFRYDGTNWSAETHPAPSQTIREVWGISDSRVFGTSYDTVLTYDGSSWSVLGSGFGSGQLYGIWGSDTDDIYVGSSGGTINHYNGTVWNTVSPPGSPGTIWSITGTGSGDVFASSGTGQIFRGVRGATVRYFNNGTEFAGSVPWNPNFLLGQAITIPYTVEMTDFGLITKGSTGSQAQMALYTDNGGEPDQLVVQSSIGAVNATGRIEYAVPQTRLDAGTYWLMAIYDAVTPIAMESSPIATPTKQTVITFGTALPTTFPVPNNETRGRLNYYIKGFAVP